MGIQWGTDGWFAEAVRSGDRLPATAGANLVSQYIIEGAPGGDVRYVEEIRDGKINRAFRGEAPSPDLTLAMSYADYRRMITEFLSSADLPSCRVEGDRSKLAPLAPIRSTPEFLAHRQHMVDITEWPDAA